MSLTSLPAETLHLVVDEICDKRTLLHLISTCKVLRAEAEPKLFEEITFTYPELLTDKYVTSIRLLHECIVTRNSPHASRVRCLTLKASLGQSHPDFHITVEYIDQILERLYNLESLTFSHDFDQFSDLPPILFSCLKRSPPPFQLKQLVWDQMICMEDGFRAFLSQQHSLTDLTLLPYPGSTFRATIPSAIVSQLNTLTGTADCLPMFPPNHITSFNMLVFRSADTNHDPYTIIPIIRSVRAFSCATVIALLQLLSLDNNSASPPSVMPNLEFVEIKASQGAHNPIATDRLLSAFSRRPIRYLRSPPLASSPSSLDLSPEQLLARISTLECIDCIDEPEYDQEIYRGHFLNRLKVLSMREEEASKPLVCKRWLRGATSPTVVTLPPRRLDQWQLDLLQTE